MTSHKQKQPPLETQTENNPAPQVGGETTCQHKDKQACLPQRGVISLSSSPLDRKCNTQHPHHCLHRWHYYCPWISHLHTHSHTHTDFTYTGTMNNSQELLHLATHILPTTAFPSHGLGAQSPTCALAEFLHSE